MIDRRRSTASAGFGGGSPAVLGRTRPGMVGATQDINPRAGVVFRANESTGRF
jgi:hypothetical protein